MQVRDNVGIRNVTFGPCHRANRMIVSINTTYLSIKHLLFLGGGGVAKPETESDF